MSIKNVEFNYFGDHTDCMVETDTDENGATACYYRTFNASFTRDYITQNFIDTADYLSWSTIAPLPEPAPDSPPDSPPEGE